ncbi:MAG: hypothetical protein JO199_08760, partial [Candidatus Eremiobacteraeota bacterium]|nr:hypothetical protein [Candidatus Eremiobacteraeota bacterium]
ALASRNASALHAQGRGPRAFVVAAAERYKISPAAAALIVGATFYRCLMVQLFGEEPSGLDDAAFAAAVAKIVKAP